MNIYTTELCIDDVFVRENIFRNCSTANYCKKTS